MRRIVLSITGAMLVGICSVQAQQTDRDQATDRNRTRQQQSQSDETQRDQNRMQRDRWQQQSDKSGQDSYTNEGMVIIDQNELPSSLKQTLQDEKYAGWENGTIYHNTNTGEYVIAPRALRFDKNGQEMEMSDANGAGQSDRADNRGLSPSDRQQSQQPSEGYRSGQPDNAGNSSDRSSGDRSREDDATGAGTQTQPGQSGREQSPQAPKHQ